MPKTVEELEKELATQKGLYEGQLKAMEEKFTAASNQIAHAVKERDDQKAAFEAREKEIAARVRERVSLEAEAHSISADYKVDGKNNDEIKGFIEGFKAAKAIAPAPAAHSAPAPAPAIPSTTKPVGHVTDKALSYLGF